MTVKQLFAILLIVAATSVLSQFAVGQENSGVAAANLAAAQKLSAASGRPIFAIAGRNT